LVVVLSVRGLSLGGRTFTPLDAAALGALLAVILAFARGDVDAQALGRGGGTGTLLLLLPGLVTFVVAVAAARLLVPGLRLLERVARGGRIHVRLAALSLARSPGRAAVAVTFLVASLGLGLFAVVYRSTLDDGISKQAAYAVPRDFTVREDLSPAGLVAPLDGWQARFSPLSRSELIYRIEPKAPPALRGAPLPADASELALPYELQGGAVTLTAVVLQPNGLFSRIDLGTASSRSGMLRAPIPPGAARGRVVA